MTALPPFVDYPGNPTLPAPVMFRHVAMTGFWLRADDDRLKALCDQVFAAPSGGRLRFSPLLSHVLMSFTDIREGRFVGHEERGFAKERELTFWILGALFEHAAAGERLHGFYFFPPYLFLDNPVALLVGREEFGYFKQPGTVTFPDDEPGTDAFTASVYGAEHLGADQEWSFRRFVTLSAPTAEGGRERVLQSLEDLIRGTLDAIGDWRSLMPAGAQVDPALFAELRLGRFPQVFLKQFRDVADGSKACYQAITQANIQVRRFRGVTLRHSYAVRFESLASLPAVDVLGLESETRTGLGMKVEMDMELQPGREIWRAGEAAA
jgi:hypothetical protein